MVGFLVKNAAYGVGRIVTIQPGAVRVRFFDPETTLDFALSGRSLTRFILGLGTRCSSESGDCYIKGWKLGPSINPPMLGSLERLERNA